MPYNAPLTQKLTMIYQQAAALSGKPLPQINFTSTTPLQVPAILGHCGRFVADLTGLHAAHKNHGHLLLLPPRHCRRL